MGGASAMLSVLQILTVLIVSVAMAAALAHVLEMPGKMRLAKDEYFAVQRIYYPGFTFAGISEPVGFLSILILLFVRPRETLGFWLTLAALGGLMGTQIIYWVFVHPVNKVWLRNQSLGRVGSGFFSLNRSPIRTGAEAPEWTKFRNRW